MEEPKDALASLCRDPLMTASLAMPHHINSQCTQGRMCPWVQTNFPPTTTKKITNDNWNALKITKQPAKTSKMLSFLQFQKLSLQHFLIQTLVLEMWPFFKIFEHLMTTYGTVTREDLDQNEEEMKAPWTPATPIKDLWLQAAKAQLFPPASDALSDNYSLWALVQNVCNTKAFDSTLKRFDELPTTDQNLARFKLEMNKTYRTWVRANQNSTAAKAGYSSVNLAQTPAPPTTASKCSCKWGTKTYTYCWSHGLSEVKTDILPFCRIGWTSGLLGIRVQVINDISSPSNRQTTRGEIQ